MTPQQIVNRAVANGWKQVSLTQLRKEGSPDEVVRAAMQAERFGIKVIGRFNYAEQKERIRNA